MLDVAGGTGDIALGFAKRSPQTARATICDINQEMLKVTEQRIASAPTTGRLTCTYGNAENLPFDDETSDAYTIALGIRNVTHIDRAISEAFRVLKPGGRFLCLEFGQIQTPVLDRLYDFHSFQIIPRLGSLIVGKAAPYQYLVDSIRKFPPQEVFANMISDVGFKHVRYRNLMGGIAALHSGWKP